MVLNPFANLPTGNASCKLRKAKLLVSLTHGVALCMYHGFARAWPIFLSMESECSAFLQRTGFTIFNGYAFQIC